MVLYSYLSNVLYLKAPQKHQKYVANALGLPLSKVVCKTKRIGGGFGGKETRSAIFAAAASVASYCLRRPVKIVLDRDVDMMTTGQRHSFLGKYKVHRLNNAFLSVRSLLLRV
jgi:xanthine dehydrogenase/oxidase